MCNWKRWNPLRWAPDGPIGLAAKRRDDWAFFLADYGLMMDSLYHASTNLPWDVFSVLKRQGRFGLFNLGGMPLATQRLENFRDGLVDLWYVILLRKRNAEIPVPDSLVKNTADFSRDPARLERWRDQMADLIESFE